MNLNTKDKIMLDSNDELEDEVDNWIIEVYGVPSEKIP